MFPWMMDGWEEAIWSKCFRRTWKTLRYALGPLSMVDDFAEARKPSNRMKISFGDLGIKRPSAQIQRPDSKDRTLGKPVPGVVNLPPKQVSNFFSAVLTTDFYSPPGEVVIVHPARKVPDEAKLI
jgi:tRNA-binding protein